MEIQEESEMNKLTTLPVLAVGFTTAAVVLLVFFVNNIVNGQLYNFGLQFSEAWNIPYMIFFNLILALLVLSSLCMLSVAYAHYKALPRSTADVFVPRTYTAETQQPSQVDLSSSQHYGKNPTCSSYKYTFHFRVLLHAKNFVKNYVKDFNPAYYIDDDIVRVTFTTSDKIEDVEQLRKEVPEILEVEVEEAT